jgi:hypothetical protein
LDGSSVYSGSSLSFAIEGKGVSINPATGEIAIATDGLLDGLAIMVTARNSAGEVVQTLTLTATLTEALAPAEPPVEPPLEVAPVVVDLPSLSGTGEIGMPVTVDAGTWAGTPEPVLALQWLRDGAVIANAADVIYVPISADDGTMLSCRVTASNASGSAEAEAGPVPVTYAAPVAVGSLSGVTAARGDNPVAVEAAAVFAGEALRFAIEGAGATIDPESGLVTVPTDVLRDREIVTVVATNSGGAASSGFQVTIEAAAEFPPIIPADLWSVVEVRDAAPAGRRRVTVAAEVVVPEGYELRFYSGMVEGGEAASFNRVLQPGETFTTAGSMAVGTTCHNVLYWRRVEDDSWEQASENEVVFEIRGLQTVAPVLVLPVLVAAPALSGAGKIGSEHRVALGNWEGEPAPTLAVQWLRDGEAIEAATGETYIPVATDDLRELSARVTATNAAGSVTADSDPIRITYVAPSVVAELVDEIFDEDTGPQDVPVAQAFAGDDLTFTVSGAGASIDVRSGIVSIPTDAPFAELVTVGASNSGGSVATDFMVTVEAAGIDFPSSIPPALWSVAEVRNAAPAGRRRVTVASDVVVPEGYELRFYSGPVEGGEAGSFNRVLQSGETFTTASSMAVGATCHNVLYWRRVVDDKWAQASENRISFQILGLEQSSPSPSPAPGGSLPAPNAQMLSNAAGRSFPRYIETGSGNVNVGYNGGYPMTLALDVLARGSSSPHYTWVRDMLKHVVAGGNEPACIGGYPTQHEMYVTSVAALLRTHAIWDTLTTAEKARWDTVMTGTLVTNAFVTSDKNPYIQTNTRQRDLRGGSNLNREWNPNYSMAMVPSMLIAMAYFGGVAQATAILDGFNVTTFASLASSQGLMNISRTYARTWGANSPTAAQIQSAVRGWAWWGTPLGEIETLLQSHIDWMWMAKVQRGLNGGTGIGGCGTTIQNLTPPNNGQVGMGYELDAWDANGRRSDLRHVIGGHRCVVQTLIVLAARGYWKADTSIAREMVARMDIGVTDMAWRLFTAGYKDYAYGGCQIEWRPNDPAKIQEWGLHYTVGLWTDIFKPFHDAALRGSDTALQANPSADPPANNPPAGDGRGTVTTTVTQYGISGTLAQAKEVGQYCSGDPWILRGGSDVVFNSFNPPSQQVSGTWRHGAMGDYGGLRRDGTGHTDVPNEHGYTGPLAPHGPGAFTHGFDGRTGVQDREVWYNHNRNLDPGAKGQPWVINGEMTIAKARSLTTPQGNNVPFRYLGDMVKWTVVNQRPAADAFRPAEAMPSKISQYRQADMNLSIFPDFGPLPSGAPNPDTVFEEIRRPLQTGSRFDDHQRSINPVNNQQNFGREIATQHANAALLCCYRITQQQRLNLCTALVQRGIDIDGIIRQGGKYPERGAILAGRKMPMFIAAMLLDDAAMKARCNWSTLNFHEDRQIFYLTQQQRQGNYSGGNYVDADVGMPEYWIQWLTDAPWGGGRSGSGTHSSYRPQNSRYILANALVARGIQGGVAVWGQPPLDYADRMQNLCNEYANDPNNRDNAPPAWHRSEFARLRASLGPRRWGPNFFGHR